MSSSSRLVRHIALPVVFSSSSRVNISSSSSLNGAYIFLCHAHALTPILAHVLRQIYGGIGIGVAVAAALSILALSNVSPRCNLSSLLPVSGFLSLSESIGSGSRAGSKLIYASISL